MKTNTKIITFLIILSLMTMCLLNSCTRAEIDTQESTSATEVPETTVQNDLKGEDMLGTWRDSYSSRALMEVTRTDNGFYVVIHWANSAFESVEWRMTGTFEDVENGRIVSTDCAKYTVTAESETAFYTDGKAHITYVNDMLYWFDATEDAGADCMFVKEE